MKEETKRLLGQCLCVGFDGPVIPEEYKALVRDYKIGNALLFKRNVKSYKQLRALCDDLKKLILEETGFEPFIMIDEESGSVSRIGHIAAPTPCAMAAGATGDPENAYTLGRIAGEELRAVGVNMDLGPVLDCYSNPDNVVIGNRSFGVSPEEVTKFGLAFMRGLHDAGVFACGKHFPGHGDTAVDSHLALPLVTRSEKAYRETDLVSFTAAIRAGIEAIMTAHVMVPALDPDRVPCTVSKRVMTGLLRQELGFEGLLISDGMEMKAVMDLYGIEDGVRRALEAGVDIALVCHSAAQAASAMEYLGKRLESGEMDIALIRDRYDRVLRWKRKLPPAMGNEDSFGSPAQRAAARRIMEASIRLLSAPEGKPLPALSKDTLFLSLPAQAVSLASDEVPLNAAARFADRVGGAWANAFPGEEAVQKAKLIVAFFSRGADLPAFTDTVSRLAASGKPVIAVSLTTPRCLDFLPDTVWKVAGWQYDELSLDALATFLGKGPRGGRVERGVVLRELEVKETLIYSAAALTASFPRSAARKNLDLAPAEKIMLCQHIGSKTICPW